MRYDKIEMNDIVTSVPQDWGYNFRLEKLGDGLIVSQHNDRFWRAPEDMPSLNAK